MKKYIMLGVLAGAAISLTVLLLRRKQSEGMEFHDFVDSPSVADDLFGKAFRELPDKP
ncbi:MAG: hypothetical protein NTX44_04270 [Ignavibacteriales bacterium]|nr:hypothetical protein [Ignavibacteriales bacterium]